MASEAERRVIEAAKKWRDWLDMPPGITWATASEQVIAVRDAVDALLAERARPTPPAPAVEIAELERKVAEANEIVADLVARHRDLRWSVDDSLKLTDALNARRVAKDAIAAARRPQGPVLLTAEEAREIYLAHQGGTLDSLDLVLTAAHARCAEVAVHALVVNGYTGGGDPEGYSASAIVTRALTGGAS